MASWHVIRSKPNKDVLLFKQLQAHGFETYFPQLNVKPVNPRASKTQPYFPGYLFVKLDLQSIGFSLLEWMPYSLGLLRFGGDAAHISEELIRIIQKQLVDSESKTSISPAIQPGDLLTIQRGPFAGYKAMFDIALSGTERARVLLLLLQNRQLAIELPANYLSLQRA